MYYKPLAVFESIMKAPDMPASKSLTTFLAHDNDDPFKCTACLARGGGDIS